MGNRSITWLDGFGDALMEGVDVAGVGNTEREEVVEDDLDEDEDTELMSVERTEDAVAEVEELVDTDELPVVGVGVVEVLQNIVVSQEDINNWATKLKPTNAIHAECGVLTLT